MFLGLPVGIFDELVGLLDMVVVLHSCLAGGSMTLEGEGGAVGRRRPERDGQLHHATHALSRVSFFLCKIFNA